MRDHDSDSDDGGDHFLSEDTREFLRRVLEARIQLIVILTTLWIIKLLLPTLNPPLIVIRIITTAQWTVFVVIAVYLSLDTVWFLLGDDLIAVWEKLSTMEYGSDNLGSKEKNGQIDDD